MDHIKNLSQTIQQLEEVILANGAIDKVAHDY